MNSLYRKQHYINIPMLLRVVGWLLLTEAGIMLIPTAFGIYYREHNTQDFAMAMGITAAVGFMLMSLKPSSREMGRREAILLTALTWVILSLFGMLPFIFCRTHLGVTDAFFETMSGFTTTGATVLNTYEGIPHSILLWRCLLQWIGGLGILLFTIAIVPMLNYQGGMQLFNAEVTGLTHDKIRPRIGSTSKDLWAVYAIFTIVAIVMLAFSDMGIFNAICYGLSTMSTGGFASHDFSLDEWESLYIKVVIMFFMFVGSVNFTLVFRGATGQFRQIWKNEVLRTFVGAILICYVLLTINVIVSDHMHEWQDLTIDPLFQAVSLLSSTGLTEADFFDWGPIAFVLLILMMGIGGCSGSTSGGAKIDRIMVLYKFLKNEFYRLMHPNSVKTVSMNGKGTPTPLLQKTLAFLFLYLIVILIGGVVLSIVGLPLSDSFLCSLSMVSNTGIGTDITGINGNYEFVSDAAKWVLTALMLIGRLELFTVLILFTRGFWKK